MDNADKVLEKAFAVLFVYDLSQPATFEWLASALELVQTKHRRCQMFLIANKSDLDKG